MKKITIIVPAFNEGKRISKCIYSLIKQTYKNIEILVINDGSTDNTLQVLEKFNDKRIKVLSISNHGQGYARNLGIKEAIGEYITFVDADDYIDRTMIEKLYMSIIKNDAQISVCNIIKCYNNKNIEFYNYLNLTEEPVINFIVSHPGPVGRLYKKSLFHDNNIEFLENCIYEDLGTIPILGIYTKKISIINEFLYYYVIRDNSSMNQMVYSKKLEDIFYVMQTLENQFKGLKNYKYVLEYLYIEHLIYSASLRFIKYKEGKENIDKIIQIILFKYPQWKNNIIYTKKGIKFKIICNVVMKKQYTLLKILSFIKR